MDPVHLAAFEDEMSKIAGLKELWQRLTEFFRPRDERAQHRADYFFSPKAGPERWDRFPSHTRDQKFVDALVRNPLADDKLKLHAQSMHDLAHGKPVSRIHSSVTPGKTYEVRKMPDGQLGCQCGDWRYKGSVTPGYECKHIRAHLEGKSRAV